MFDGNLRGRLECAHLPLVAPEAMVSCILLLNKGVIACIGSEEGLRLSWVAVFGDLSKGASKFVFTIFSWNVSTISRYLGSRVADVHDFLFITPYEINLDALEINATHNGNLLQKTKESINKLVAFGGVDEANVFLSFGD